MKEVMAVWGNDGGFKDITSSWCHHQEFWLRLWWHLISIPSEIAQEDLAGAKSSSPKKVKAKGLGEELASATRLCKASTSVPWMRHRVVWEWVRIWISSEEKPHIFWPLCTKWSLNPSRFLSGSTKVRRDFWNWWLVLAKITWGIF